MESSKRIGFVTSSRADFGKLKALMVAVREHPMFDLRVFVTGMHLREKWGHTINHLYKEGWDCFAYPCAEQMVIRASDVTRGMSYFIDDYRPDLVVIHGDKTEAHAAATAASIANCRIAHVEGGEVSGTIDGILRHSITKLADSHFVASSKAAHRVLSLQVASQQVYQIGSPEVDTMLNGDLPSLNKVTQRYGLDGYKAGQYGILLYHPVTTEVAASVRVAALMTKAVGQLLKRWVLIRPNDDTGSDEVYEAMQSLLTNRHVRMLPSMRFEHFLTLLRESAVIMGNSSCGVREAPVYGVASVNLGSRQRGRMDLDSILTIESPEDADTIAAAVLAQWGRRFEPYREHGHGDAARRFIEVLETEAFWQVGAEKVS